MDGDKDYGDSVMAYAAVKYWAAKAKGPREPGQRPEDLTRAAEMQIEVFETMWRAGYRHMYELFREVHRIIKERRRCENG